MDEAWDAFVARAPGGHHLQTARWGRVKAVVGLRAVRVVLERDGAPAGGVQVLLREVPVLGAVGYAARGPLVGRGPEELDAVLGGLRDLARRHRVAYLKVQPPVDRGDLPDALRARGFRPSELQTAPAATVRVALTGRTDDELLAAMRATTRRNVRLGERRGVTVREGRFEDLPALHALLAATGERQGFPAYALGYFEELWRAFSPGGHVLVLLAEHEGRPVSGALFVAFGDTVIYKVGGWRGERSNVPANELLHWTAMRWARDRGHAFYDFEGIPLELARGVLDGTASDEDRTGVARFKLGFGGDVELFPLTQHRAYRPVSGRAIAWAEPHLSGLRPLAHRLAGRG